MNIEFIPSRNLKSQYRVFGHFYDLKLNELLYKKCRSVIEISTLTSPTSYHADAIFVMMNPGSSRPADEATTSNSPVPDRLVQTVPDTTQYQVMRVMHNMGWQKVRVINLSDLRDPCSGSFAQIYAELETKFATEEHSIFSKKRCHELAQHLIRKPDAPIVLAWGVSDSLNPLIERARKILESEHGLTGLEKSPKSWKYFHPLPALQTQKEEWVAKILEKLNAE